MENLVLLMKMMACLIGGIAVGNWFFSKARQGQRQQAPWYQAYFSVPGLIIILALIFLPIFLWLTGK